MAHFEITLLENYSLTNHIYIYIYIYKQNLALDDPQGLISHKKQPRLKKSV